MRSATADEALAQRIVTVHQDINLVQSMTVLENLLLNNEPASRFGIIRRRVAREIAEALLDRYEIAADPEALVGELSNDLSKMIQIVKAIDRDPKVLILDEPTSSLTDAQVNVALRLIRQLASQGVGLVLISHYLSEIFEVCDDLTVMRDGEVVADRLVSETTLPQVVAAMVGREVKAESRVSRRRELARDGAPRISVENLTVAGALRQCELRCPRGRGPGRHGPRRLGPRRTLARHLRRLVAPGDRAGPDRRIARPAVETRPPRFDAGIALLTNDRLREGILPDFTADREYLPADPVALRRRAAASLNRAEMEQTTDRNIERLRDPHTGSASRSRASFPAATSRKFLFAKWLETEPKVFVMDEPTIGVDVGAKDEIRKIIDEIAARGRRRAPGDDRAR